MHMQRFVGKLPHGTLDKFDNLEAVHKNRASLIPRFSTCHLSYQKFVGQLPHGTLDNMDG